MAKELSSTMEIIERLSKRKSVVLYKTHDFERILKEILSKEFRLISITEIEDIVRFSQFHSIEFIFTVCSFKCSLECNEIFRFMRKTKVLVGITMPVSSKGLNKEITDSFVCLFYKIDSFTQDQNRIAELVKGSRYYVLSNQWKFERFVHYKVFSVQRNLIENNLEGLNIQDISKSTSVSRSYLSDSFRKITGQSLKGLIEQVRICNSLYLLNMVRPIWRIAYEVGVKEHASFTKIFRKIFDMPPSQFKKKIPPPKKPNK